MERLWHRQFLCWESETEFIRGSVLDADLDCWRVRGVKNFPLPVINTSLLAKLQNFLRPVLCCCTLNWYSNLLKIGEVSAWLFFHLADNNSAMMYIMCVPSYSVFVESTSASVAGFACSATSYFSRTNHWIAPPQMFLPMSNCRPRANLSSILIWFIRIMQLRSSILCSTMARGAHMGHPQKQSVKLSSVRLPEFYTVFKRQGGGDFVDIISECSPCRSCVCKFIDGRDNKTGRFWSISHDRQVGSY